MLICHVTSREHMFIEFAMFDCHWSSARGDIKYLMSCDLTKSHN